MLYIGIDLGTSACKLLLVAEDGSILNTVTKDYPAPRLVGAEAGGLVGCSCDGRSRASAGL